MEIINLKKEPRHAIKSAIAELSKGNLIIYPTETCYGLGADVGNPTAINKLFSYKGNRRNQIAIAVSDHKMASQFVKLNELARNIYSNLLPGPITVISKSLGKTIKELESPHQTLGIRIPNHPWTLQLIAKFGKPVTTTSANTSGKKQPYSLSDWQKYTSNNKQTMVSLFIDAGHLGNRPTSTVVDTTLNEPSILRQGELTLKNLTSPPVTSKSPQDTTNIACQLITHTLETVPTPLIVALQGKLGAGKTQFAKGIAQALKINDTITSPTYTIMKEYPYNNGILYHIDTWRLENDDDLFATLNLNSLLKPGNVVVIEWLQKTMDLLKNLNNTYPILWIDISDKNEITRLIRHHLNLPRV